MKNVVFIISLLLLSSCINENTLSTTFPIQYLHGNSAKVWILSKSSDPLDKNVAAMNNYRKTFIFYANNRFKEQVLIHLASNEGMVGKYTINEYNEDEFLLTLYYSNKGKHRFIINTIDNQTITLQSLGEENLVWEFNTLKPPKL